MAWKKNKRLISGGFRDLEYLPGERAGWDCTLAALAYGVRRQIERGAADLNAWAARHGLPASGRFGDFGPNALVLWHGTSRERAEKMLVHGLFHKRGLWTTREPWIAHSYCRGRSERFATEGAVACLVLDRSGLVEGRDFSAEGSGEVLRFHHGLPPEVVEYVLTHEEMSFVGDRRARRPRPWPKARLKKRRGGWVPVQKTPVRYSNSASYCCLDEFVHLSLERLLAELGEVAAVEIFSCLYSLVDPREALPHKAAFELIEEECLPYRQQGKWRTLRRRSASDGASRAWRGAIS
jgi:hypothetical protein